ncbi:MAG: nitrogenase component 1 [Ethanoligenens sp.]
MQNEPAATETMITREKRLSALSALYDGTEGYLEELENGRVAQRIRTFSQEIPSDLTYALRLLSRIQGVDLVVHGPEGCAVPLLSFCKAIGNRWAATNLRERDLILGGEGKLRTVLKRLSTERHPALICILATPPVSVNNDDINAAAASFQKETGIKTLVISTTGFRSRIGLNGYDEALQALLDGLAAAEQEEDQPYLNLLSVSESLEEIRTVTDLFADLGLRVHVLPSFADLRAFRTAGCAAASVCINPDESAYLGEALEKTFGVPFVRTGVPIGYRGTAEWLEQVTEIVGISASPTSAGQQDIRLDGRKIYIAAQPVFALALARFLEEQGAEVVGLTLTHVEVGHVALLRKTLGRYKIHVADGQGFELTNILDAIKLDLFIGRQIDFRPVARLGIPVVSAGESGLFGYRGADRLLRRIRNALLHPGFVEKLAAYTRQPYQEKWLRKKPSWHIKREVR